MTLKVRDWLPAEVASRAKVRETIDAAVLAWSQAWFANQRLQATRFRPLADSPRLRGEDEWWRAYRGPVTLSIAPPAAQRMVSWVLDAPLARLELTPRDAAVTEGLEHAVLDDLTARIETLLDLPDVEASSPPRVGTPGLGQGGVEVAVTDEVGALILSLALPFEAVLPLAKASLPAPRPPTETLSGLGQALAPTPVKLQAALGHVEIGVADLRRLAIGDVLVLDRGVDQGVLLDLPGSTDEFTIARLGEADGRLTLTLESLHV